jgi:hypothetical protein
VRLVMVDSSWLIVHGSLPEGWGSVAAVAVGS